MATPPMLEIPGRRLVRPRRPDPASSLAVLLLSVIASGLVLGGILAVYDWRTPGALTPLVWVLVALFGAALCVVLLAAAARWLRGRPG